MPDGRLRGAGGLAGVAAAFLSGPALALTADCVIDPSRVVELASPTGGILAEILVEEGDEVESGEVVARLVSDVEQASVSLLDMRASDNSAIDAERSRLAFLEGRLERTEELSDRGVVTQDLVEELRTQVETSRSLLAQAETTRRLAGEELKRAEAVLARLTIASPIDGVVARKSHEVGEYLAPEDAAVTIVSLDPLEVMAFLPASEFRTVAIGDVAEVRLAPPVEGVHEAVVTGIDRVFDVASGTFRVKLSLDNPDLAIPGGHRCILKLASAPAH